MTEPERAPLSVIFAHDQDQGFWKTALKALRKLSEVARRQGTDARSLLVEALQELVPSRTNKLGALHHAWERAQGAGIELSGGLVAWMAELVLNLEPTFEQTPIPVLVQGEEGSVSLTRRQCASLLAASFFGVLPGVEVQSRNGSLELPDFQLDFVLENEPEKVLCLLCYFGQLFAAAAVSAAAEGPEAAELEERVSFERRVTAEKLDATFWNQLDARLRAARVVEKGAIEDAGDCLQADFANQYLGGGALCGGNVQEEIRFAVCPECYVGMLFCAKMLPNEAILIVGARQYSKYGGYGHSFHFESVLREPPAEKVDSLGRRGPHIAAFDALVFPGASQYEEEQILRELLKLHTALLGDSLSGGERDLRPFATGNWGCGVFGGDPQLKALLQWLAASHAGRELVYFPFGDRRVAELPKVIEEVQDAGWCCSDLFKNLQGHRPGCVFEGLRSRLAAGRATG